MKKLLVIASTFVALSGAVFADIQAPPGSTYTATRKLGRALSNIVYGFVEIPEQMVRKGDEQGRNSGYTYGIVDGTSRGLRRLGYGCFELITFTIPTYRGTFKPPYQRCGEDNRIEMNVKDGLSEFPPELGFENGFSHSRVQTF